MKRSISDSRYSILLLILWLASGISSPHWHSMLVGNATAAPPSAKKSADKQKDADAEAKRAVRLPANFGKLGLSDTQKDQMYEILKRHKQKIDELEAALDEAKENRDQELRKALSAEQRALLKQLETKPKEEAK
jgi:hypothetical protein